MERNTCPSCGHPDKHTALMGCLDMECDCTADWAAPKTLEDAHQERDAAMAKAERGTDPDWEASAVESVLHLARMRETFTPDDVWDNLAELKVEPPREPRALGPVMKRLTSSKRIRSVGFTESRRRHGAPVRIYEAGAEL